jgi:hypothetical protein
MYLYFEMYPLKLYNKSFLKRYISQVIINAFINNFLKFHELVYSYYKNI